MAVDVVAQKLEQANEIKKQIREAANTKDVDIPEDAPFADYPGYVSAIPGHLQTKTLIPTTEGFTALPDSEYQGFSAVTLPAEPNLDPQKIAKGFSIFEVMGTAEIPEFDVAEFFAGTLTEFTFDSNTSLRNYAFYNWNTLQSVTMRSLETLGTYVFQNNTVLTTLNFPSLKTIGTYAMYGCTALTHIDLENVETIGAHALYNCKAVTGIGTIKAKTVNTYGCYYLGNTAAEGFVYAPESAATVGTYAFEYAKVTAVEGPISSLGTYAFAYCSSMTKLHPKITGSIGSYGFAYCYAVNDLDLSECAITTLSTYAFYCLGANRSDPSTNILTFDLRKSKFTTVNQYALAGTSTYKLQYATIHLPETVTTISTYAFTYCDNVDVYFYTATPPTLSGTTCFSSATNYKLFVPYGALHAYKTATNWSSLTAYIIGYAPDGTFEAGTELPAHDDAGYALTWYTDAEKTNAVTVAPDAGGPLYCEGGDRTMWVITASESASAQLTYTGTDGIVYTGNPAYIPIENTAVTVNIELVDDYEYKAYLGSTQIEFPYELELSADTELKYFVMDGSFNPDFATATWAEIQYAVLAGAATALYADYVGTLRSITLKNGTTMNVRLVNCTDDMYERSDGTKTGFVLQFEELYATTYKMNSSNTNVNGWSGSYMRSTVMPIILAQLPDDLAAVLATVKIKGAYSGSTSVTTINTTEDKLFLPAEGEITATRTYSRTTEFAVVSTWQYYANNTAASYRIKKRSGTATAWWLRSPYSGGTTTFVLVYTSGSFYNGTASTSYGVAPGFCI